jgi:hypothetical protein
MPEIEVNLIDQSGKNIRVRLPDDRPIGQLAAAIRRKLNMPETDERGRLQVVLHHKVSGRDLQPERTLAQESVQNGETLRLRMEAVAGGRKFRALLPGEG